MPISVNMTKARVIHLTEIRRGRNLELAAKDLESLRATETGNTSALATVNTQ